ncbi:MAG: flagellar export chaperone FliS [Phycisphaeraceae bacterium]|nr:flagellar export chaperone FliS [Phycisphaeraceae bacterium]
MTTTTAPANAYLRTKVMTASPAELRLLLLDGAIRAVIQGRDGIAGRDFEAAYEGISRAQQIILELMNGLRPANAPELCERMASLYTYMYTRLVSASSDRNPALADEVRGLLEYERETWAMVMAKMADENTAAAGAAASVLAGAAPGAPTGDAARGSRISIRG